MVKVTKVKYTEIPFESNDKNFQKCIDYIKTIDPDYKKYLPKNSKHHLSFEIEDATSDLANCIRRYLIDEMPVYSMNVDEDDIKSDDRFILTDFLKKNIELIPFTQYLTDAESKNLTMHLHVENKTDDVISVHSSDIEVMDKNKKLNNEKYFTTTIPIIKLRPGTMIDIKNINVVSGIGKVDSGKFILLSNISYEILDVVPLEENKFSRTGHSSLVSNPTHFKFGLTTHRHSDIKKIMPLCCDSILNTMELIKTELSKIKESDKTYFSDTIELETKGDVKLYYLKGEYWTIANIISKYCYIAFKDIQFVCAAIIHPSTETSIVKIRHTESIKILLEAIKLIIADINTINKAF